ncbi:hypothetical protein [Candidatus Entotheonella palauensis]|uniref:Uncharacterized protein n=1 Tax=Candidatus Entotheonella gemina TaxID=1429439 RepID=W4LU93_9BACT|nr:hypothetical protein [Candidatus Entotheonella palauensis]ETX01629.1 MAG: hypothetical protein ETSY2_36820 [Candidatus Entotheonella gemina]
MTLEVRQLETSITEAAQTLLEESDPAYLQGLTRHALSGTLEVELNFLGFCRHDNIEAQEVVRNTIARHLTHWMDSIHHLSLDA